MWKSPRNLAFLQEFYSQGLNNPYEIDSLNKFDNNPSPGFNAVLEKIATYLRNIPAD
jgi:hypothetical protein